MTRHPQTSAAKTQQYPINQAPFTALYSLHFSPQEREQAALLAYTYSPRVAVDPAGWIWVAELTPGQASQLAQQLQLAAGSAPSRSSAQLAALGATYQGYQQVTDELEFIARVPLEHLGILGFTQTLLHRLQLFGLVYLGDLHRHQLSQRQLEAQFGPEGLRLYQIAHGQQTQPIQIYQEAEVLQEQLAIEPPAHDPGECRAGLQQLAQTLSQRLNHRRVWRIGIRAVTSRGVLSSQRLLGQATAEAAVLERAAWSLLQVLALEGAEIEALSLQLGSLERPRTHQTSLWGETRRSQIDQAIQQVHRHYPGALVRLETHPARFREEGLVRVPL